jgi:hypothetical protein
MPLQPTVLWAQRADRLLLTIDLQACKDPQIRCAAAAAAAPLMGAGRPPLVAAAVCPSCPPALPP